MSSANEGRQATMDSTQIYREETFTDRKVGTIRRLTPVSAGRCGGFHAPGAIRGPGTSHDSDGGRSDQFRTRSLNAGRGDRKIRCGRGASGPANHAGASGDAPRTSILAGHPRCSRRAAAEPQRSAQGRTAASLSSAVSFPAHPIAHMRSRVPRPALASAAARRRLDPCRGGTAQDR